MNTTELFYNTTEGIMTTGGPTSGPTAGPSSQPTRNPTTAVPVTTDEGADGGGSEGGRKGSGGSSTTENVLFFIAGIGLALLLGGAFLWIYFGCIETYAKATDPTRGEEVGEERLFQKQGDHLEMGTGSGPAVPYTAEEAPTRPSHETEESDDSSSIFRDQQRAAALELRS
jgi:hypothetical protein